MLIDWAETFSGVIRSETAKKKKRGTNLRNFTAKTLTANN
jgi:hypothetical protein